MSIMILNKVQKYYPESELQGAHGTKAVRNLSRNYSKLKERGNKWEEEKEEERSGKGWGGEERGKREERRGLKFAILNLIISQ